MTTPETPGQPAGVAVAALGATPGAEHPAGAGAPAGIPTAAPWHVEDGGMWQIGENADQPWTSAIPEESVRQSMETKGYKNPGEVAMAYHSLMQLQTGNPNAVALPGADATPEQIDTFYSAKGRPDAPEGYEFNLPEGTQIDEGMKTFASKMFHKTGMNQTEAAEATTMWQEYVATEQTAQADAWQQDNEAGVTALKDTLGESYDQAIEAGKRVMNGAKLSAATIEKVEASIGTAGVLELLSSIGMASVEGGLLGGGDDGGTGEQNPDTMTPAQANAEIAKLNADAEFQKKYTDANHPEHKDAVEKVQRLYARA